MNSPCHFACTCVGPAFDPVYVQRLYQGIARNFSGDWDFTVIVDKESEKGVREATKCEIPCCSPEAPTCICPAEVRIIQSELAIPPSWWAKLNYFRTGIWPKGETIFALDLDTAIIGSLDRMAARTEFNMLNWGGDWFPFGSGIMIFPAGAFPSLAELPYDQFQHYKKGDQEWIYRHLANRLRINIHPIRKDEVMSYKRDFLPVGLIYSEPETSASIIAFHGKPRPHELDRESWCYKQWVGAD